MLINMYKIRPTLFELFQYLFIFRQGSGMGKEEVWESKTHNYNICIISHILKVTDHLYMVMRHNYSQKKCIFILPPKKSRQMQFCVHESNPTKRYVRTKIMLPFFFP